MHGLWENSCPFTIIIISVGSAPSPPFLEVPLEASMGVAAGKLYIYSIRSIRNSSYMYLKN